MNRQKKNSTEMKHRCKNVKGTYRLPLKWWELLAYVLIFVLALVFNAMQFPKWVVVPLVLAILLVRPSEYFSQKEGRIGRIKPVSRDTTIVRFRNAAGGGLRA
ncbi:hypothetical protein BLI708_09545 [Bifidobacterium imperatoris]|uniref:Uncharacterized protein n=1 Tax=Bifidobacterium imperatoris TaxID=2020965 RepID=A0A2N5IRU5_9BIFI|nr:hypothetical protein [Bifidobacterium imperatoris]PLS24671.1 hypothetical protein Tam1G_1259 [Bifidobacterium imperatoris]QSY57463.1 hypothetical protein BLI708_09545 [Bifidobacterium imperatoris]